MSSGSTREIGSEFYLNEEDLSLQNVEDISSYAVFGGDTAFLRSGRDAIGFVVDNIEPVSGIALLPAYSCTSMAEPFIQRGYRIRYYRISKRLTPHLQDIREAFREEPDIMLYMDWFGLPVSGAAVCLARSLSKRVAILEDCTHSIFSEEDKDLNEIPDYAVASLRKWFGMPDGAVAIAMKKRFNSKPEAVPNTFTQLRREALLIKGRYMKNPSSRVKDHFRSLFYKAESSLDGGLTVIGMSAVSLSLFHCLDRKEIVNKRRDNYKTLEKNVAGVKCIKPLYESLTENICPFCYPVLVDGDRDFVQRQLAWKGIYCPVLWPLSIEAERVCAESAKISAEMLSIPCDQRYTPDDMIYIADAVRDVASERR